jgi:sugar lactone lactonase YvrE
MKMNKFSRIIVSVLFLAAAATAAGAVTVPSKSIVNPVSQVLYVANNGASPATIRVYTRVETPVQGWTENTARTLLVSSPTAKANGMALSADGTKLLVALSDSYQSVLRIYSLDAQGLPTGGAIDATWTPGTYADPGGIAIVGNRVYVSDNGDEDVHVFSYNGGSSAAFLNDLDLPGILNLDDVAATAPDAGGNYLVFVSRKANSSTTKELFVYSVNGSGTATLVNSFDAQFPTSLKVVGNQLYMAINGTDGDIRIYDISAAYPYLSNPRTINNSDGVTASLFGLTAFDVSKSGRYLFFTQAQDQNEISTKLYKVDLTTLSVVRAGGTIQADGVTISPDGARLAVTYSGTGAQDSWNNTNIPELGFLGPIFGSITPTSTTYGNTPGVIIYGQNFFNSPAIQTQPGLYNVSSAFSSFQVVSSTQINATLKSGVPAGQYKVQLKNANLSKDGISTYGYSAYDAFTVNLNAATLTLQGSALDASNNPLPSGGSIRWTWNMLNQGENDYALLDGNGNTIPSQNQLGKVSTSIEQGLASNTLITRKVKAYIDNTPVGAQSAAASAYSSCATPYLSTPAVDATPSVTLNWTTSDPSGTKFEVYRKTSSVAYALIKTVTSTGNSVSYADTTVVSGTTYTYKVRGINGSNQAGNYSSEQATPTPVPSPSHAPSAPTNMEQYKADGTTVLASPSGRTNSKTVVLKFTVSDPDQTTAKTILPFVRIDGGSLVAGDAVNFNGTNVTTSITVANLADGTHSWDAETMNMTDNLTAGWVSSGKTFVVDTTGPSVTSTSPINNATGVALTAPITITFSEPLDQSTLTANLTVTENGYAKGKSITYDSATNTVTLTPSSAFGNGAAIVVAVNSGIKDLVGNPATVYIFSFTALSTTPPTVTRVYPSRAPNSSATNIVIEGTLFTNTTTAAIQTPTATPLTGIQFVSSTKLLATVPAGIAAGTYHITVSNATITSAQTSADTFQVTNGNENPSVPSQIKDLKAVTADTKVTLSWTNPTDNDMASLELRRYPSTIGFPVDHNTAGYTPLLTEIPAPGAVESYPDTNVVNGTTYYYVAFIKDTSGNWSTVESTAPNINAVKATPGTTIPITNLSITRDADTVNSSVSISWQSDPVNAPVDVYMLTGTFTTDAAAWTKTAASTNITTSKFTDATQVGTGTAKYYKVVGTGATLQNSDLAQDVVGKFDLSVGPSDTQPERALISLPLQTSGTNIASVFGTQPQENDAIAVIDNNFAIVSGKIYTGGSWQDISGTPGLNDLNQGYAFVYTTLNPKYMTVVGKVLETSNTRSIVGGTDANGPKLSWIANSLPMPVMVSDAKTGLNGLSSGADATVGAQTALIDANASIIGNNYALHNTSTTWVDTNTQSSTMVLEPGRGYMLTEPTITNYSWTQSR